MEEIKMRCHFSVVFERIWTFWAVIAAVIINQIDTVVDVARDLKTEGIGELLKNGGLLGLLVIVAITLLVFILQVMRWRKTWVTLSDNVIILERNTLNRVRNTIAIENISSVNLERNLFERIVGTSKIKLDTNSMTTAGETDVALVFSEDKAIMFRKAIIDRMNQVKGESGEEFLTNTQRPETVPEGIRAAGRLFTYNSKDLVMHCVYSASISNILIVLGGIIACIWLITSGTLKSSDIMEAFGGIVAIAFMFLGSAYNLIKKYIVYYGFRAYRDGDDIHLQYGLLKLRSYTIPIDKITAIKIRQPAISRIFKKYQVEIKTVGLADEKNETSNLTMAISKEELFRQMEILLPEFKCAHMFTKLSGENPKAKIVKTVKSIKWIVMVVASAIIIALNTGSWWWIAPAVAIIVIVFIVSLYVLAHKAAGIAIENDFLLLVSGHYEKRYTLCRYEKIQKIVLISHPVANKLGILTGKIEMLDNEVQLPYITRKETSDIENILIS